MKRISSIKRLATSDDAPKLKPADFERARPRIAGREVSRAGGSFSLPSPGQEPSASSQAGIERLRRRSVHPRFLCRALTGLGERQDW